MTLPRCSPNPKAASDWFGGRDCACGKEFASRSKNKGSPEHGGAAVAELK